MFEGIFKFENDLLKHHVRINAWLPKCKNRLRIIRRNAKQKSLRKLRYFTFCAVGAIDVLMLDVAKVIIPSDDRGFNNVVFFDKNRESVIETQKRIPGSVGFAGNFVDTVLMDDPDEEYVLDGRDPLISPESESDKSEIRGRQLSLAERQNFIKQFPFDVINLDLEEFLFKPNDPLPGKVINSLRKMFAWQRKPLRIPQSPPQQLDGFSLMLTTQIGPPNLSDNYLNMLKDRLSTNLSEDAELERLLALRAGITDINQLRSSNFDMFFKLALPKVVVATLMEEDWYIDPDSGILVFEFERPSKNGPYKILHLAMDIKRQVPPRERRAPGEVSLETRAAYRRIVRKLFGEREVVVSEDTIDRNELERSLDLIRARRRKYYPENVYIDNTL